MMGKTKKALYLVLLLLFVSSCGYARPGEVAGRSSAEFKGIHVVMFENSSYRLGIESMITTALVEEMASRSGGAVVPERDADLILSGKVVSYSLVPVSYTSLDLIREYRVTIKAEVGLRKKGSGDFLWKQELSASQVFPTSFDLSLQRNAEDAAAKEASHKLAGEIWRRMDENF